MTKTQTVLKNIVACALFFLAFSSLNSVKDFFPLSIALFTALLFTPINPFILSLSYLLSSWVFSSKEMAVLFLLSALVLVSVFQIYKSKRRLPQIEVLFYVALCLLPYVFLSQDKVEKMTYTAIILIFTVLLTYFLKAVKKIDKKHGLTPSDGLILYVFFSVLFYGFIRRFSLVAYVSLAMFILLFFTKLSKGYFPLIIAITLSSPLFFFTNDASWFLIIFIWYFLAVTAIKKSKITAVALTLSGHFALIYFLGIQPEITLINACVIAIPQIFFGFLSNGLFENVTERFRTDYEELLIYSYINRTRTILSSTLYELGGSFAQLQNSFSHLKNSSLSLDSLTDKICEETLKGACTGCVLYERCKGAQTLSAEAFKKTVELAIGKKRISLIDLPKEFTDFCGYPNSIIFEINRLIGVFSDYIKNARQRDGANDLFSLETDSIATVLKKQAFELSKSYTHDCKKEAKIMKALSKKGFKVHGILFLNDEKDFELNLFLDEKQSPDTNLKKCLEDVTGEKLCISRKINLTSEIVSASFKKRPELDACFGIKRVIKNQSAASGDSHSLIKLDENRFLIAISDGMGSGERAMITSQTSLDLIEGFYKCGLDEETVLKLVNKILSFSADDNFSAIDVAVVDLNTKIAGFIKVGAPYGFILSDEGVKYIEGSSLPVGILDELQPSTALIKIQAEDIILLFSDGVTDAFNSSSDFIEFLRVAPHKNPQALCDSIIDKAVFLSGGTAKDDMTVVAVRIIDNSD
ncbi:MAG: SpoIIE family protein phosphatase [Christensenellaceae bacterium]